MEYTLRCNTRSRPPTARMFVSVAASPPSSIQAILKKIRTAIRKAAPDAQETISYQIPAFMLHGQLAYFAAFKKHIGFYPPVTGGDQQFKKAIAVYAGSKDNLQFPLDKPILTP